MNPSSVRIRTIKSEDARVQHLLAAYDDYCRQRGLRSIYLRIDGTPISTNHTYQRTRGGQTALKPSVNDFRWLAKAAAAGRRFEPTGVLAVVIVFCSSVWLTKKRTVREIDLDNKIKGAVDAVKIALHLRDQMIWDQHAAKLQAAKDATHVWVFDLGDVVDYYMP